MGCCAGDVGAGPKRAISPAACEFIASHLKRSDMAYIDYAAFYPATTSAKRIFTLRYMEFAMTPEEKRSINVLVISPSNLFSVTNSIPGDWKWEATFDSGI